MSQTHLAWTAVALMCVISGTIGGVVRGLPLELPALAQASSPTRLEVRLAETVPAAGLVEATISGSNERVLLHDRPVVTGADVASANAIQNGPQSSVAVTFTPDGASRLRTATQAHLGRPMAIVFDGLVIAAPTVRSAIGESAMISGITADQAKALAESLAPAGRPQAAVVDGQDPTVTLPVAVTRVRPEYTPAALDARIEGVVGLSAVVGIDGTVEEVRVTKSLDTEYGLDEQAIAALRQWTFEAGRKGGEPVPVRVAVETRFTLK